MKTDLTLKELLQLPPVERERPYPRRGWSKRARSVGIGVLALVLVVFIAGGVWRYLNRPTVPDVMGLSQEQARQLVEEAGLSLVVSATLYSVEPAQTIIGQTPAAGSEPLLRRTVRVVLSSGKQAISVPNLKGESELRARSVLEQSGLNAQVVYEYAPDDIGKVVSTKPAAGQTVQTGDIVVVRVGAPRSQIALVEYDLHSSTIVLTVANDEATSITHDIALRLSSLLQAAQATVLIQDAPVEGAAVHLVLSTDGRPVDTLEVMSDTWQDEAGNATLASQIQDNLKKIPLAVSGSLVDWKEEVGLGTVEVRFGTAGDVSLYRDTRWKDNVARSLYLAIGQTLVR